MLRLLRNACCLESNGKQRDEGSRQKSFQIINFKILKEKKKPQKERSSSRFSCKDEKHKKPTTFDWCYPHYDDRYQEL